MSRRCAIWIVTLIPLPAILVATLFCADTLAGLTRNRLLWPEATLTIADAIVLRDTAEVVTQLLGGVDPNAPCRLTYTSRLTRKVRRHAATAVTPLEAAVWSGEPFYMQLLAQHGAMLDEATLLRLRCEADRLGENRIVNWIDSRLGRGADCGP